MHSNGPSVHTNREGASAPSSVYRVDGCGRPGPLARIGAIDPWQLRQGIGAQRDRRRAYLLRATRHEEPLRHWPAGRRIVGRDTAANGQAGGRWPPTSLTSSLLGGTLPEDA